LNDKKPFSILNGLKGVTIGMANIVPGVSGGTLAVITGIYDELVDAFGNFFSSGWKRNTAFLTPVITGVLLGNIAFARIIGHLFETAPAATNYGFMGLILGSLPYILKHSGIRRFEWRYLLLFAAGFVVVLAMGLASRPDKTPPLTEMTILTCMFIFGAAFLASAAMVIPGISGSFLLLLIGMYTTLQHGFSTVDIPVILLFTVGTISGVIIISKAISALLKNFHRSVYAAITGLIIGSAVALYPGPQPNSFRTVNWVALLVGLSLSLLLGTNMKERLRRIRYKQ
jgi:putative membrane protein